ncbi:hypothetical protein H6P81_009944 [Aristolochia fimbriata]|uniref:FAR1 domain-containing protein n=1 Tax=Aristolochia fimbriata TaxID=158543 RepID=A0AAV7ENJ0_ARIFI|nr:hypothetical protein H6P81_009944 [Aristolochia fimbriata]
MSSSFTQSGKDFHLLFVDSNNQSTSMDDHNTENQDVDTENVQFEDMDDLNAESPKSPDEQFIEPTVGMQFDTFDEAFNFYNSYAFKKGFSVRRDRIHTKGGVKVSQRFVCAKQGKKRHDKRRANATFSRAQTRCECEAKMYVRLNDMRKVEVKSFTEEHTHECITPRKAHMLRSHRSLSKVQAAQANFADAVGIAPKAIVDFQSRQADGRESLGYINMDLQNYLRQKRQKNDGIGSCRSDFRVLSEAASGKSFILFCVSV